MSGVLQYMPRQMANGAVSTATTTTANTATGRATILAADGATFAITNSLVTAASHVFCRVTSDDGGAPPPTILHADPTANTITITLSGACGTGITVDWWVVNPQS